MRTEILIWIQLGSERCRSKAFKVAATVDGVKSVTVAGEENNLLLVIGDGVVDASRLTRRLRNHVGYAEIVELTTTTASEATPALPAGAAARPLYHGIGGGGGLPWLARVGCPVTVDSVVAANNPSVPTGLQWPAAAGEALDVIHSPMASYSSHPSPYYHCSPLAVAMPVPGAGGYALDVVCSHPANYSPMIERHDRRRYPVHSCCSDKARRDVPSCCTIL